MNRYVTVNRIEFPVTYRCNSHCRHCFLDTLGRTGRSVDRQRAVEALREVCRVYPVTSVMTFGGEPLLYPDVVCAIHAAAAEAGVERRELITNAGTPRSDHRARELAERLARASVNAIAVSVDTFHQEFVPIDVVKRNVVYYLDAGIDAVNWNPCWVESAESDNRFNDETRSILQELEPLGVRRGDGNVLQPEGSALSTLLEFMPQKTPIPGGSCRDVPYGTVLDEITCITIEPNGDVTLCPELSIGNIRTDQIVELLDRYDPHAMPETGAILKDGMSGLVALCAESAIEPDAEGYYSICGMCTDLRRALRARTTLPPVSP